MRRLLLPVLLLHSLAVLALGGLPPLLVKDISLMLRSGYSVSAIEQDLATRHFLGPVDAAAEKQLKESGGTTGLIADLKGDRYAVPASEIAAVQQEVEAKAKRRAAMEEEAQKFNTRYQDQVAKERAASAGPVGTNTMTAMIKGDLVTSRNGILQTFNDQELDKKKLIGLYFSARWCGPCRKFTPELVTYYNRIAAAHPEFEIVFISNDRNGPAMEAYMRDMQMPWPAVKFEKIPEKAALTRYAGGGIPCLVVIDAQGRVLSDSYVGKAYRGPQKVLADLDQFFAGGTPAAVAQSR